MKTVVKGKPSFKWLSKDLFKACMFAKYMIEENDESVGLAIYKAGQYYGYSAHDVAVARNKLKQFANSVDGEEEME